MENVIFMAVHKLFIPQAVARWGRYMKKGFVVYFSFLSSEEKKSGRNMVKHWDEIAVWPLMLNGMDTLTLCESVDSEGKSDFPFRQ